ncbi:MAG: pilus assembly protein CpaF [Actinobacteria bacterium]|nr:MAG: pilus assembly protein CpaF [Actinomycetota bacterium]
MREHPPEVSAILRDVAEGENLQTAINTHIRRGAGEGEHSLLETHIHSLIVGVGPDLAPLIADETVTDILVNSTDMWVDRGGGLTPVTSPFGSEAQVRAQAVHMAAACGRRLDDASPIVDGTLPNGVRLHAVLPPLSGEGTLISLRTSRPQVLTLDHLLGVGTVSPEVAVILNALISLKANTLISGATGSGKTTLLSAVLALVPDTERIVCIEEVSELRPSHPHVVHLQERRPNVQGAGAVTLAELVRAAMRMRPDRIVLGECRGGEVRDVMSALNTGHDGGWATLHANAVEDVPARLSALGALAGMDDRALTAQATAAFDAVIQMRRRTCDGHRYVNQIGVFTQSQGSLACQLALTIGEDGEAASGPGWEMLARRLALPVDFLSHAAIDKAGEKKNQ